ncbi:MAG: hypothetical protein ACRD6I_12075 [Candidatus Acidiferrales bacterium]
MEKARRKILERMPTRKLIASVKKDIRRIINAATNPKRKKK